MNEHYSGHLHVLNNEDEYDAAWLATAMPNYCTPDKWHSGAPKKQRKTKPKHKTMTCEILDI